MDGQFGFAGSDGLVRDQLEAGRRAGRDRGSVARTARRPTRALGQERLDDAVFQRVEGDDHQPTARLQHALGGVKTGFQLAQLVIDRDAQTLERAGGGMDLGALAAANGALDHLGQVQGALERALLAAADDEAGDAARGVLLAIDIKDAGQLDLVQRVDEVGGGRAAVAHPHVQRTVAHEGKAALGLIQLHRRDAQVQHHTVDARRAQFVEHL
jgi:hypothetical protein